MLIVLLFSSTANKVLAQLEQVIHEEVATGPIGNIPAGYSVYRIYALLTAPNFRVSQINAFNNAGFEHRLQVGSCSTGATIWNSPLGGGTGDDANCSNYTANPDLQYDSYLTIQRTSSCISGGAITTTPTTSVPLNNTFATAPYGVTLNTLDLTVSMTSPLAPTGVDNRVLIAQVTVPTGSLVYALNLTVTNISNTSIPYRYVHTLDGPFNSATELNGMQKGLVFGLEDCDLCNDSQACNYSASAVTDLFCENASCAGCTNPPATNYNPQAQIEDGSCYYGSPNLMFTEFCYGASQNLPANHPQHFVEIYNPEFYDVDISNWVLQYGMSTTFPAGTVIGAQEYLVVTTPNQSTYTPAYNRVLLSANDQLSSLDSLALRNNAGVLVDYIRWTWNATDWPTTAFNVFASVCLSDPTLDNSNGSNWCHSAEFYGSPGAANTCRVLGCNNPIACNYQP
jgi:hypothetical protein